MKLYCNLAYRKCFECDGKWVNTKEEGLSASYGLYSSYHEGMKIQCLLPLLKYGKDSKNIKLISEFKWLMNRAIYRGKK
jgi:hypothetical protein